MTSSSPSSSPAASATARLPAAPFDLTGVLPAGRVAIEASAGTGKTYTLATLVARYVAERDLAIDQVLVVTFTRAAAAELRSRVRARLNEAAEALRLAISGASPADPDDELLVHLCREDVEERLRRLERAVADFDSATITTIHGFAQQVLATLGSGGPSDLDAVLSDDTIELVGAVCADVLGAEAIENPGWAAAPPDLKELLGCVLRVMGNPGIELVPHHDDERAGARSLRRRRLVDKAICEVARRRRIEGTLSFDDLLTRLHEALVKSPAAVTTLRRRYLVALVDEFQDTDPVQWELFKTLFGCDGADPRGALVLVGDPKQAIYAFRGANVHTYLEAVNGLGTSLYSLGVNRRSDGALLGAISRLLRGATFGDERIAYAEVQPCEENAHRRLAGESGEELPALIVRGALGDIKQTKFHEYATADVERAVAADLAIHVRRLLDTAWVPLGEASPGRRPLRPENVAVLIGRHAEAAPIQQALAEHGIAAVVTRGESVMRSMAALHWRWLLSAIDRPSDPRRARTAALSWFFGWPVERVADADDEELGDVQETLARWSGVLEVQGTAELCTRIWAESGVAARVLGMVEGDRHITDLDHISELLQAGTAGRRHTPAGLLGILDRLANAAAVDPENDITARRVESDERAVQIMTVHNAKGLEFDVVCVPTLWKARQVAAGDAVYQDPVTGRRTFDIANADGWPTDAEAKSRLALADSEALGESLRLLYVAMTRARHQTLLWWSRARYSDRSGLARILFARHGPTIEPLAFSSSNVKLPPDDQFEAVLESVFGASDGLVSIGVTGRPRRGVDPRPAEQEEPEPAQLAVAVLGRRLARLRRRWSFSAIADRAHEAHLDPEDESMGDTGAADEDPAGDEAVAGDGGAGAGAAAGVASTGAAVGLDGGAGAPRRRRAVASPVLPLGSILGGTRFGTLVHDVLELVDFTSPELEAEVRERVGDRLRFDSVAVETEELVAGLCSALRTPLGPLFGGRRLCDLSRADRLDELSFELRLGEGGTPATERQVGALVLRHLDPGDPLVPWAELVAQGLFDAKLAGHLTGSIDLVARVRSEAEGEPDRYVLADYKTNKLTPLGAEPGFSDYAPVRLAEAMAHHHYPLQALLYSVALHRYLRWRVRGYDPAVHLGGAAYLFVRGMAGPETPCVDGHPYGLFPWRIPSPLVTELSDLLDGRLRMVPA